MRHLNPQSYPRRVLVCVTGMSPAVVTETLYALATQQQFFLTELIVLRNLPEALSAQQPVQEIVAE